MEIVKLNASHINAVRPLFERDMYMGVPADLKTFQPGLGTTFADYFYEAFITTYLSDLKNYHSYGIIESGIVKAISSFYESNDEAAWYGNHIRSLGGVKIKPLTDALIAHNEQRGRFKFYTMIPTKYTKLYRRFAFSDYNNERYDLYEEFMVPEKHQCMFSIPWQILYNRSLMPTDTVVRCSFLKQKYRKTIYNAGRL